MGKEYKYILSVKTESKPKIIKQTYFYVQWYVGAGMCWFARADCVHLVPTLSSVTLHQQVERCHGGSIYNTELA